MTIDTNLAYQRTSGDGTTTVFSVPFALIESDQLMVELVEKSTGAVTAQSLATHYTLTIAADHQSASVTFLEAPASTHWVVRRRNALLVQATHLLPHGRFPADLTELAIDRLTLDLQAIYARSQRALHDADSEPVGTTVIPPVVQRAGKFLAFDNDGNPIATVAEGSSAEVMGFLQAGTGAIMRTLQSRLRESLSAGDFGASGGGILDDAPALRKAFDAAAALEKPLNIPAGTFRLASALESDPTRVFSLTDANRLVIRGVPGRTKLVLADDMDVNIFYMLLCHDLTFEGIEIDGNGANQSTGSIMIIQDCERPKIVYNDFHDSARNLLHIDDDCRDIVVQYNLFHKTHASPVPGQTSHGVTLSGDVSVGTGKRPIGGTISYNAIWDTADSGINASECELIGITDNDIYQTGTHDTGYGGVRCTNGARKLQVRRNRIRGYDRGLFVSQVGDSDFCENMIANTRRDGIYVVNGLDEAPDNIRPWRLRITGNKLFNPGQNTGSSERNGIILRGVVDSEVTGNDITDGDGNMIYAIKELDGASNNSEGNRICGNTGTVGTSGFQNIKSTFTPTVSFATNGDFAPTYSTQEGHFRLENDIQEFWGRIEFDANAYTTASGTFRINGLPYASRVVGALTFYPITIGPPTNITYGAGQLQMVAYVPDGESYIELRFARSDNTSQAATTTNIPADQAGIGLYFHGRVQVQL